MDTNIIKALIDYLEAKSAASVAGGQNAILIVTMIISALAPTLASIMAYFKAAAANERAAKAADSLEEIHVAVNSKEAAMVKKLEDFQLLVLKLTEQKAASDEQLKWIASAAEVERQVSKERGLGQVNPQFPQPPIAPTHIARSEVAAVRTEAAAERVEMAAEKTEKAIDSLTDAELSVMIKEINAVLASRRT